MRDNNSYNQMNFSSQGQRFPDDQEKVERVTSRYTIHPILLYLFITLIIIAGILWIISSTGRFLSSWSLPLSTTFAVLSIVILLIQTVNPFLPLSEEQAHEALCQHVTKQLSPNKGGIVIFVREKAGVFALVDSISKRPRTGLWIDPIKIALKRNHGDYSDKERKYKINNKTIRAIIFCDIEPGDYVIWTPKESERGGEYMKQQHASIAKVSANQVTSIDWRVKAR